MFKKEDIITIDGPAGVGKSTVSRKVAAAVGFSYLDTGAMYRAVGLYLQRLSIDLDNERAITDCLNTLVLELSPAKTEHGDVRVFLNGEDVSDAIRTPDAAMLASRVSALPSVRIILTKMQQNFGRKGQIVAEGRDTGTVVFPKAAYKFFLDAQPEERARRRCEQLQQNGVPANLREILALTLERDHNDRNRTVAPLQQASDALLIDTTALSIEKVVEKILEEIKNNKIPT